MMGRIYIPTYLQVLFFLFYLLIMSPSGAQSAGIITSWEQFQIKKELELKVISHEPDYKKFLSTEEMPVTDEFVTLFNVREEEKDRTPDGFRIGRLRISFSRIVIDRMKTDLDKISGDEQGTMETIKSITTLFRSGPYRDSFESIGKIFEPQVNLGIEF
ncbi:MAG: hypothetical protein FJ139_02440 [Deltaproteobacteria bacterium]|nr:hypothetical protein [Deltaproteobacteria bacterium]